MIVNPARQQLLLLTRKTLAKLVGFGMRAATAETVL
jgi:hypothetical protein